MMEQLLHTIQQRVDTIFAAAHPASKALYKVMPVAINAESVEEAYYMCHPVLGRLLQLGWMQDKAEDTESIKTALLYCAYTGLLARYLTDIGKPFTPKGLLNYLGDNGGAHEWILHSLKLLALEPEDKLAKQLETYFAQCKEAATAGLPKHVDSSDEEIACINACMAMFLVGRSLFLPAEE